MKGVLAKGAKEKKKRNRFENLFFLFFAIFAPFARNNKTKTSFALIGRKYL
jgi:hypothetical protein